MKKEIIMTNEKKSISPIMKVSELLNEYPMLEDALIELSPDFKRLKNPILRNTIAKVTTLAQAAKMAGIPVEKIISTLRSKAGLECTHVCEQTDAGHPDASASEYLTSKEDAEKITAGLNNIRTIDARPMLEKGEHPVGIILEAIQGLNENEGIKLITPFIPLPLIEKVKSKGLKHISVNLENDVIENLFYR